MRKLFLIIIFLYAGSVHSQTAKKPAALIDTMCSVFTNHSLQLTDMAKAKIIHSKYIIPYIKRFAPDKQAMNNARKTISLGFFTSCDEFLQFFLKVYTYPTLREATNMPKANISAEELNYFHQHNAFHYTDVKDCTGEIIVTNDNWLNISAEKGYTKCKINWLQNDQFELKYLASSNPVIDLIRPKGDSRYFKIIDKKADHFVIATHLPHEPNLYLFNLYFK